MNDGTLLSQMNECIGQTVTIFTASGGASGCGFTGVLLVVNSCFVRIMTRESIPPANPLSQSVCSNIEDIYYQSYYAVGSTCDIPVANIVSFCHNAI